MANKRLVDLTSNTSPASSHVIPMQDSAGTNPPVKVAISDLKNVLSVESLVLGTKTSHGFAVGYAVYKDASGVWQRSTAADSTITSTVDGIIVSVTDANNFVVGKPGTKFSTGGLSLTAGTVYYLATTGTGVNYTSTEPSTAGQVSKILFQTNVASEATIINGPSYEIAAASSGGGDVAKLGGATFSAVANVNIFFDTYISTYRRIVIVVPYIIGTVDGVDIFLRTSPNGSTFDSGTFDYTYGLTRRAGNGSGSTSQITVLPATGIVSGKSHFLAITVVDPNQSTYQARICWEGGYHAGTAESGNLSPVNGYGIRGVASQIKGIQLYPSSGTITGEYQIWGYK